MKVSELERYLKKQGCKLKRHGAEHDRWVNPKTGDETSMPRHGAKEIPKGTVNNILKELGLK